ncbi:MAG: hypothetical protein M1823_003529 [Watsoniomyces obsoletus]|nr:MAG: hypothetical protein M1823_003529 [Watsoniomyces obsoletus]
MDLHDGTGWSTVKSWTGCRVVILEREPNVLSLEAGIDRSDFTGDRLPDGDSRDRLSMHGIATTAFLRESTVKSVDGMSGGYSPDRAQFGTVGKGSG